MRRNMDEPTEWRTWGMYAISKEGYMKLTSYIPCGKPVGTYLIPRTVGSRYPRYRTTKKGNLQTHRISALLKKVWGISQEISLEVAEVMRENAARWNIQQQEARLAEKPVRRARLPRPPKNIQFYPDYMDSSDPFVQPNHPQYDPFSNWR